MLYVRIKRTIDSIESAEYSFTADDVEFGQLRIDKNTGDVALIRALPGDDRGMLYVRAAAKLRKELRNGALPELTEWAS
jgi:hypothetical protein